jgi:DNA-binding MarR family transcriptional regulator
MVPRGSAATDDEAARQWTFLSNHGHVLVCIARDPDIRLSDLAHLVGIRERAAHRIVNDLVEAGYVKREKRGRRNHYVVRRNRHLRHPIERVHLIGELLAVVE